MSDVLVKVQLQVKATGLVDTHVPASVAEKLVAGDIVDVDEIFDIGNVRDDVLNGLDFDISDAFIPIKQA